jgi:hypothetical protein
MKRKRVEQQGDRGAILRYAHHPQTCCEVRRYEADEASRSLSLQAGLQYSTVVRRFLVEPRRLVMCARRER